MTLLSQWLALHCLVAAAGVVCLCARFLNRRWDRWQARDELFLNRTLFFFVILLAIAVPFLPLRSAPKIAVWSAPSMRGKPTTVETKTTLSIGPIVHQVQVPKGTGYLLELLILVVLGSIGREVFGVVRVFRRSVRVRKMGRLEIRVSQYFSSPFSLWIPGRAVVIVPEKVVVDAETFALSVAHEIQHHRQRDTVLAYPLLFVGLLTVGNPIFFFWSRAFREIQEFACDESLVGRQKFSPGSYAASLWRVAQTAVRERMEPSKRLACSFFPDRHSLKRRIQKMIQHQVSQRKRGYRVAVVLGAVLLGAVAFASSRGVQDRRISMEDAEVLAAKSRDGAEYPLPINERVLAELNRYVGTPDGREYMRNSLERMEAYRSLVSRKLEEYGVPKELMAIPIIESGYQNLPESNKQGRGAGLWMFIKSTARNYGLRVDKVVDERTESPELLSDAAMRYLTANRMRFKDWELSVLSYNVGEGLVQRAIDKLGTRDVWTLIRKGVENDHNYMPRLVAAILIMKNPGLLN